MDEQLKVRPMKRLMMFAKPHKQGYILSTVLAVLGVFSGIMPYYAVAHIVLMLIGGQPNLGDYVTWGAVAVVGYAAKGILMNVSTTYSHKATFAVMSEVRCLLADKLVRLPLGYVTDNPSGILKTIMVERIDGIEVPLAHAIPEMTANLLVPLVILFYIAILDWRMALVSLVTIPLGALCYLGMMKGYDEKYAQMTESAKYMSDTTVEYINGIEVIKTFNQSTKSYQKFSDSIQQNTQFMLEWVRATLGYSSLMSSIWPAVLVGLLPFGGFLYLEEQLSVGDFTMIIILALGMIDPLIGAVNLTDDISKIRTIVGDIGSILDEPELVRPEKTCLIPSYDIELCDVWFGYGKESVLKGINLKIRQGAVTALVGPSGGGKSTIAKLIASLWNVTGGQITIGGVDVRRIPMEQLMDHITYVAQDNYLFDESIRDNIRMGNTQASNQDVEAAAKASGCHEFIINLEHGYDTIAGGAGGKLSGGERQRIAIARAMLKNTEIVILDEATSFTDPENEAVVQGAVARLIQGKTLIVIAHRLSTVIDSDQIVVIDKGEIVSVGTHHQLLEECSLYKKMWEAHESAKDAL